MDSACQTGGWQGREGATREEVGSRQTVVGSLVGSERGGEVESIRHEARSHSLRGADGDRSGTRRLPRSERRQGATGGVGTTVARLSLGGPLNDGDLREQVATPCTAGLRRPAGEEHPSLGGCPVGGGTEQHLQSVTRAPSVSMSSADAWSLRSPTDSSSTTLPSQRLSSCPASSGRTLWSGRTKRSAG